jgi:hypothetical protein
VVAVVVSLCCSLCPGSSLIPVLLVYLTPPDCATDSIAELDRGL